MKKKENFKPNGSVIIDGTEIKTYKTELTSCNILEVEVGTTGKMGGDAGHGCKTYFKIKDQGSTYMHTRNNPNKPFEEVQWPNGIEMWFGGDCELDTLCEALRIGYEYLKEYASPVEYYTSSRYEERAQRFSLYINQLCELYRRNGNLNGMGKIRSKNNISGITKQQFFEFNLHHAKGYVNHDFCDKVYEYILDNTKSTATPNYDEQ